MGGPLDYKISRIASPGGFAKNGARNDKSLFFLHLYVPEEWVHFSKSRVYEW